MFQFFHNTSLGYKLVQIGQPWMGGDHRILVAIIKDLRFYSLTTKGIMVPYRGGVKKVMEEVHAENQL